MLTKLFRKLVESRGLRLSDEREAPAGFEMFLRQCRARGLRVDNVIDVGVGHGTPWLYEAFPEEQLFLFEPLSEFEGVAEALVRSRGAKYMPVALGEEAGTATISVAQATPTSSTLLQATAELSEALSREGRSAGFTSREIPVETLDGYAERIVGSNVLKIDAEGFELGILKGGRRVLAECHLLILEISLIPRYEGEATLKDLLAFLEEEGFALYEIIELSRRRADAPTTFMDVAFVPAQSALRFL
ncbi:MAG: FkbM family methyltransferase [Pseudomonadota bacterium]